MTKQQTIKALAVKGCKDIVLDGKFRVWLTTPSGHRALVDPRDFLAELECADSIRFCKTNGPSPTINQYSQSAELDADQWDSELRAARNVLASKGRVGAENRVMAITGCTWAQAVRAIGYAIHVLPVSEGKGNCSTCGAPYGHYPFCRKLSADILLPLNRSSGA